MSNMEKRVRVIGVPLDLGVSKLGVDMGPTALRYAGILDGLKFGDIEYTDSGDLKVAKNFSLDTLTHNEKKIARFEEIVRVSNKLAQVVDDAISKDEVPIILGGDHSTSIGSIAGIAKSNNNMGLIWLDAHPDCNTPETSPSSNIHGMPLAISLGYGPGPLVNCFGFSPKLRPENICIIGTKDIDKGEQEFINSQGIRNFTTFDIENMGIATVMKEVHEIMGKTEGVYLSFDADVMDQKIAPGTGIMTKGGLNYREISYIMRFIGENIDLIGMDIIEVNPLLDKKNKTAELCVELTMACLGIKYTDYEKMYLKENVCDSDEDEV